MRTGGGGLGYTTIKLFGHDCHSATLPEGAPTSRLCSIDKTGTAEKEGLVGQKPYRIFENYKEILRKRC